MLAWLHSLSPEALIGVAFASAIGLCLLIAVFGLVLWLLRSEAEDSLEGVEVKSYPPGCTCIPGALTDNPSCPVHGPEEG